MQTTSFRKSKYFILFINDFSGMTVYFIKEKAQAFEIFKEYVSLAKIKSDHTLEILCFDNEEYTLT